LLEIRTGDELLLDHADLLGALVRSYKDAPLYPILALMTGKIPTLGGTGEPQVFNIKIVVIHADGTSHHAQRPARATTARAEAVRARHRRHQCAFKLGRESSAR